MTKPTKLALAAAYKEHSIPQLQRIYHVRNSTINKWLDGYNITRTKYSGRRHYPTITRLHREFILGTLLGDGCLTVKRGQAFFECTHSDKQKLYAAHKMETLSTLKAGSNIARSKGHYIGDQYVGPWKGTIFRSIVHPYLTELHDRIYINGRKTITKWWLDQLTMRSIAYWFMDDGCADYRGNENGYSMHFATYSYSYNEHLLIKDMFRKIGLCAIISPYKKSKYLIRFNTNDAKKLRKSIRKFIIPSMLYKVDWTAWRDRI